MGEIDMDDLDRALWRDCIRGYEWPEEAKVALGHGITPSFDKSSLLDAAARAPGDSHCVVTFLSREYLPLGALWADYAVAAGVRRFAIGAADSETATHLARSGLPHFEIELPAVLNRSGAHRNRGGFETRAMELIYSRLHVAKYLLDAGIDVLCCDIDALILADPFLHFPKSAEVVFQRVAYFPRPLARRWGFTACGGFVGLRATTGVNEWLLRVLAIQREVSSDQLAINLALLEGCVEWSLDCGALSSDAELFDMFERHARKSISGRLSRPSITIEALPANTFWRHKFVHRDKGATVLMHPNSPKSLDGKLCALKEAVCGEGQPWLLAGE